MYHFKRIFLFFSVLILMSCELYTNIKRKPSHHPTLTVHAFMSQHDVLAVLSYTQPMDSLGRQVPSDLPELEVWLTENGKESNRLKAHGTGIYGLDSMNFSRHIDYAICVKDKTGEKILESGPDRLPVPPEIISAQYIQDTTTMPEANFLVLELDNPANKYNGFDISRFYSIDAGDTFQNSRDSMYGIFDFRSLIKPKEHNPGILNTTIKTATFLYPEPGEPGIYIDAISVRVKHLSSGMMLFFEGLKEAEEIFNEPFATRSPVYSNVTGGYGIFGSYSYTDSVLFLEK